MSVRLTLGQKRSLERIRTQIIDYEHGYSYIETDIWGNKPHHARTIHALRDKGLIVCYKNGNGTGEELRAIPYSGAFTAQLTRLGEAMCNRRRNQGGD